MDRGKAVDIITDNVRSGLDEYIDEIEGDIADIKADLEQINEDESWEDIGSVIDALTELGNKVY